MELIATDNENTQWDLKKAFFYQPFSHLCNVQLINKSTYLSQLLLASGILCVKYKL
jgi:hypothetical protein